MSDGIPGYDEWKTTDPGDRGQDSSDPPPCEYCGHDDCGEDPETGGPACRAPLPEPMVEERGDRDRERDPGFEAHQDRADKERGGD